MLSTSGDDDEIKMRTLVQMFKNLFNFFKCIDNLSIIKGLTITFSPTNY